MLQLDGERIYSASDLVSFLECEHSTSLALIDLETPLPRGPEDEQLALIQAKGLRHEKAHLEELRNQAKRVIDINAQAGSSIGGRVAATLNAMREGYDVIYQAAFRDGCLLGYADFLVKVETPSQLGPYSYEAVDTKLALAARSKFLVQLAFYSHLLAKAQGYYPEHMRVVLGTKKETVFRCADYRYYFDTALARFLKRVRSATPAQTYPEPCDKCSQCHWNPLCEERRLNDDHLSQVANISRVQIRKLVENGVPTLAALATMPPAQGIPKMAAATLERLRSQAELQHTFRQTGKRGLVRLTKAPGDLRKRGFERLPAPDKGDIFFDMEGNPLEDGGLEYLFGVWEVDAGGKFKAFWAHNRTQEKLAFEAFMDYVDERLQRYPHAHIYHYAPYEPTALKKLMSVHGTREAAVDNLLRRGKLIDLYAVVREALRVSQPSYSIKYIERFYQGARAGDVTNAGASIIFYERWKALRHQDGAAAEATRLLQDIADYNRDDVVSTWRLARWLRKLRPAGMPWANESAGPTPTTETAVETPKEAQLRMFAGLLFAGGPVDEAEDPFSALVWQMLAFHRREAKPEWWAMFKRMDMTHDELIEDTECLGGLVLDTTRPPQAEKRSYRFFYKVPPQDTKLRTGASATDAHTRKSLANLRVDMDKLTASFTVNKDYKPAPVMSIGPANPIETEAQESALAHFAMRICTCTPGYRAVFALLRREAPRIAGLRAGDPLVDETSPLLPQVINVVSNMDETCLFMQGPPGAGKTFTGSHVIVELLRQGKRVGVTSNSHHAINNLLHAVEERAGVAKLSFSGAKKSSGEETLLNGAIIKDIATDSEIFAASPDLVAGTSWLFAKEEMREQLDYLFVDEAGQMALANLVAVGLSAKNIVLLGDQMQLAQPSKGTHPGRSGDSTLDYLLDGLATIPADKGIFLKTSYRMHPDVCRFISDAVYDGRLESAADTRKRFIAAPFEGRGASPMTGIRYVPVEHDGNSQSSLEEVERVVEIVNGLLRGYRDDDPEPVSIKLDDILVVAPYNVQVNELKRALPAGARVGTVDKFQGQEAHVVILSMATSNADYLPRDIEFLFSKNRLNVAISRAKALAILVASPDLLAVPCSTPAQMALVNTLCALVHYSGVQAACHSGRVGP